MEWIPALFKQLGLSRSVVFAIFITALTLYVGPKIAPDYVEPVPKGWSAAVVALLVFSAVILSTWGASSLCIILTKFFKKLYYKYNKVEIDPYQYNILYLLSETRNETLSFDEINYIKFGLSRAEMRELVDDLNRKKLVTKSIFDDKDFTLSSTGRQRVLKIQGQDKYRRRG